MSHVIELAATYRLLTDIEASLCLEGEQAAHSVLTVIHERFAGDITSYDFTGPFCEQIQVAGGESLTIIARIHGRIVGCLVNEIDAREISRVLLHPKGGFNLIVYQSRLDDLQPSHEDPLTLVITTPRPPTPATLLLAKLLRAATTVYISRAQELPLTFQQVLSPLNEAIAVNEEAHSRQMLGYLCAMLEELELAPEPGIRRLYDTATTIMVKP